MMKRKLQLAFSSLFFFVSLPMLVWGFWPPRRETIYVPLAIPDGMPSLPEARTIRLEYAPSMRAGDSQVVELSLVAEGGAAESGVYEQYNVLVESRLDLPLADARPADAVSAALTDGRGAAFYWDVTPRQEGTLRGTAWLYLRFVPQAGGVETRQPVSAQLVEIRSKSLLKRTGSEARIWGVVGSVIGLAAGFPFVRRRAK